MEDNDIDVLNVIQEIMETERSFHAIVRFLDGGTRNQLVAAQMRNTNNAMSLVRQYMQSETRQNLVVNIPLQMDLSGNFFDPIPVVPTQQQINSALENHIQVNETVCSICQENVTCASRIRSCGHCFHGDCIRQWFSMNPRCPMCRVDIRDDLRTINNNTINDNRMHTDEE
jgi:hypothetical protein